MTRSPEDKCSYPVCAEPILKKAIFCKRCQSQVQSDKRKVETMKKFLTPGKLILIAFVSTLFPSISAVLSPAIADTNSEIKAVLESSQTLSPQEYSQSIDVYGERIRKNPKDVAARFGRGYILFLQKQYQRALPDTNCAVRLAPESSDVFNLHGFICLNLSNYKGAIADFDRAIALNPSVAGTYCGRGSAQRRLGNFQAAVEDFSKALELMPGFSIAYTGRGNAYRKLNVYDKAIQDYDASLKLSPNQEVEQLRAETVSEQRLANAQKLSHTQGKESKTEDLGSPAANQYVEHLKEVSLLAFAQESQAAIPNSQEAGYLIWISAKRLPKESSENILETIAQLNPDPVTAAGIYWQLYGEAKSRDLDPFAKVPPTRLAYYACHFPEGSDNRMVFSGELVQRLPKLSAGDLRAILGVLPIGEVLLRDEVMKELQSRTQR